MLISEFDFDLPDELIAQNPPEKRDVSRMLVVEKNGKKVRDAHFYDLPALLQKGDVLVLNNTKVFPARLFGTSESGAKIEVFLVRELENQIWETLAKPARRLKTGKKITFADDLSAEVTDRTVEGRVIVKFTAHGDFDAILERVGSTPLPPYIKRADGVLDADKNRYQTVFATQRGAIAAPTAGLHFTAETLAEIEKRGVEIVEITLHVGYGTFEPVRVSDLAEHRVMAERGEISAAAADAINRAKNERRRVIAIGTTTTRALESNGRTGEISAGKFTADLTVTPGYEFKIIDGILTNFHLPQSSLLVLIAAFAGYERTLDAYRHAVLNRYRFYSYGDCMLIV